MASFNVVYFVNGQTVTQKIEADSQEEVRTNKIIKESQWIKDSKDHDVYINFDKVDMITIRPQGKAQPISFV